MSNCSDSKESCFFHHNREVICQSFLHRQMDILAVKHTCDLYKENVGSEVRNPICNLTNGNIENILHIYNIYTYVSYIYTHIHTHYTNYTSCHNCYNWRSDLILSYIFSTILIQVLCAQ